MSSCSLVKKYPLSEINLIVLKLTQILLNIEYDIGNLSLLTAVCLGFF